MSGELYLMDDERGWFVILESRRGDSSGIDGPYASRMSAVFAGRGMAVRLDADFAEGEAGKVLAFATESEGGAE